MAIRWVEGFETHRTASKLQKKYQDVEGYISSSWLPSSYAGSGRYHGYAVRGLKLRTRPLVTTPTNTWTIGVSVKLDNSAFLTDSAIHLVKNGIKQLSIVPVASGSGFVLEVRRGSTVLDTGTTLMYYNTWYYIEVYAEIDTGTSGSIKIRTDEVVYTELTSVDTANSGSAGANEAQFDSGMWLDDIYIKDDADFLGIQVVEGVFPNEDDTTEWDHTGSSDYFEDVNDDAESDDGDSISTSTSSEMALFGVSTLSQLGGYINAVQLNSCAQSDRTGISEMKYEYKSPGGSSTDLDSVDIRLLKKVVSDIQETNPITGESWSAKDISDGFFGVKKS